MEKSNNSKQFTLKLETIDGRTVYYLDDNVKDKHFRFTEHREPFMVDMDYSLQLYKKWNSLEPYKPSFLFKLFKF